MDLNKLLNNADDDRLRKGRDYFKQKRVKNAFIYKNTLIAEVIGSNIYRVKINLKTEEMSCTCPDMTSCCKHIIAVLLVYNEYKKFFTNFDKLSSNLLNKSKQELIDIIKQISIDKIDLVTLLKIPQKQIIEIKDFSKDLYGIEKLFNGYVDYEEVPTLLRNLEAMENIGINFMEKGHFETAFAIFWSLIRVISKRIGECDDSNGEIGDFFYKCISNLLPIINKVVKKSKEREKFFIEVFSLWENGDFGIEEGFLDLISSSASEKDKPFLIKGIDNLLAKKKSKYFEEYRKPDLEDLKNEIKEVKDATT